MLYGKCGGVEELALSLNCAGEGGVELVLWNCGDGGVMLLLYCAIMLAIHDCGGLLFGRRDTIGVGGRFRMRFICVMCEVECL